MTGLAYATNLNNSFHSKNAPLRTFIKKQTVSKQSVFLKNTTTYFDDKSEAHLIHLTTGNSITTDADQSTMLQYPGPQNLRYCTGAGTIFPSRSTAGVPRSEKKWVNENSESDATPYLWTANGLVSESHHYNWENNVSSPLQQSYSSSRLPRKTLSWFARWWRKTNPLWWRVILSCRHSKTCRSCVCHGFHRDLSFVYEKLGIIVLKNANNTLGKERTAIYEESNMINRDSWIPMSKWNAYL